jgi:membrane protein
LAESESATDKRAVREAESPFTILRHEWWSVLKETWAESSRDNVSLIAAGTAFWGFAAIAPLLAATVLTYGLFATPEVLSANIRGLFGVLPRDAAALIADQLAGVVETSGGKKGWALVIALLLAVYGGTQGASALISALNIAYEETEKRSIFKLYGLAFAITGAAVVLAIAAAASTTIAAFIDGLIPGAPDFVLTSIRLLSYLVLAMLGTTAAALLYRYAPDRTRAQWIWLTPGSLVATGLWIAANAIFALYVSQFGNYGATYGSLSAVVVLLFWLWLSAYAFLLGGELNSQLERRTAKDTTVGPPAPVGQRGAAVADSVGVEVLSPAAREAVERTQG